LAWQLLASSYEISYPRKLLADISPTPIDDLEPTLLYGDNMGAIATASSLDGDKTPRSRDIDIRYHITREALANGTLRLEYVRTDGMTTDILTKPLPVDAPPLHEQYGTRMRIIGMQARYLSTVL
jgi:hypothetical protein